MSANVGKRGGTLTRAERSGHVRWIFLLQGIVAVALGLGLLIVPERTLFTIILLLGAYWLVRGIATLLYLNVDEAYRGWKIFVGVFGIAAGLLAIVAPLYVATAFFAFAIIFIGIQALLTGAAELYLGIRDRSVTLSLLGLLSIFFGALLLLNPWIGAAVFMVWLGVGALLVGMITIVAVLRGEGSRRAVAPA